MFLGVICIDVYFSQGGKYKDADFRRASSKNGGVLYFYSYTFFVKEFRIDVQMIGPFNRIETYHHGVE